MTGNWVESGKIMEGALNPSQILQPPPVPSTQYPVPGAAFLPHLKVGDRWGTPRRYLLNIFRSVYFTRMFKSSKVNI
ncbi:hypothetical protein QUB80_14975 [Chlorogloeopsis sp. ULAP01]|uniref:hypothetical protein n=1 Tax=Chlorogloeopsis sp. ULAP01 TaxID=3056483 RepID=UPI0025AA58EC|nr:hypothetical protein [Chlorogloeopsis sp. ULAP01]MDM9382006.1 hypothetical protein [Chlorogloeopsis sp. ULAP01]